MAFLQKVSFCNFIRNNPWLFSACQRKKIVIAVASFIVQWNLMQIISIIQSINKIFKIIIPLLFIIIIIYKLNVSINNITSSNKNKKVIIKTLESIPDANFNLVYTELNRIKKSINNDEDLVCMINKYNDNFYISYPLSPIILKPCTESFKKGEKVIIFTTDKPSFEKLGYKTDPIIIGDLINIVVIKE